MNIAQQANYYKKRFNHSDGLSLYDLYDIADELDVTVIEVSFSELKGAYYCIKRNKFIILDSNLIDIEKRFVFSHELGHAIFHRNENCFFNKRYAQYVKPRMELEADEFSSYSLLPNKLPIDEIRYYTFEQLASLYNVPCELMRIKLNI